MTRTGHSGPPGPRVVIGVPLFENAGFLSIALESLTRQTYRDFALLLVDDASSDATPEVAKAYAVADERILFVSNDTRLGLLENWRRCVRLAVERFPSAEFFAWASDHDVWRPHWLEALVDELDRHPEAALAYPMSIRIDQEGERIREPWRFDTSGIPRPGRRLGSLVRGMYAGSMVYGLFRVQPLLAAGTFRRVLQPDRLLLTELAFRHEFRQVPEILWERRFGGLFSNRRQRATLFCGTAPWYTWLPPATTHFVGLLLLYVLRGAGKPDCGRLRGGILACRFASESVVWNVQRVNARRRKRMRKLRKEGRRKRSLVYRRALRAGRALRSAGRTRGIRLARRARALFLRTS
jgi:hypothetical protein